MLEPGNTSISATSVVDGVTVAYFNASFSDENGGNYSVTKSIANRAKYSENQSECVADYEEFERCAIELAAKMEESVNEEGN